MERAGTTAPPIVTALPSDPIGGGMPPPTADDETNASASEVIAAFTEPASSLGRLRLSEEDKKLVYATWQQVMADCMRQRGFEMVVMQYEAIAGSRVAITIPVLEADIEAFGYHSVPAATTQPDLPNERRMQVDIPFRDALTGGDGEDDANGCIDVSRRATYDDEGEFTALDQQLGQAQVDLETRLIESRKVGELNARWAECMRSSGFEYDNPSEPLNQFAISPTVTKLEIDTRRRDVFCQLELDYVRSKHQLLEPLLSVWIEDNAQEIYHYESLKADYLRNIVEVRDSLSLDSSTG